MKSSILRRPPPSRGGSSPSISNVATLVVKKYPFLLKVLATLLVQLGISFYTMYQTKNNTGLRETIRRYYTLVFICQLVIIILLAIVPLPIVPKFLLFTAFSVMNGLLVPLYVPELTSKDIIDTALQTTFLFISMALVGLIIAQTGIGTTYLEIALFAMAAVMVVWGLYLFFVQSKDDRRRSVTWYRNFTILFFALYIIYDTYNILRMDYNGDFVTAAFDYYLDIFNIFRNLLILDAGEDT